MNITRHPPRTLAPRTLAIILAMICSLSATLSAQDITIDSELIATNVTGEFDLVVSCKIPDGWNTYGSADTLTPIQFKLNESDEFQIVGDPEIPTGKKKDADGTARHYLRKQLKIRQRIKTTTTEGKLAIHGNVRMTLCRKEICKPPKSYSFSVEQELGDLAAGTANAQASANDDFTIDSLKSLQADLLDVVQQARSATVGLMYKQGLGTASGVIVSPDGLILTAGHCVIEPGSVTSVILADGREFDGTGIGIEPGYDCGLMKIDAESLGDEKLPYAKMGWSSQLKVNEPVFSTAHGGEFDQDRGAYLRFGRVIDPCSKFAGYVHSTCLMEPGDSGGPLFNLDGMVVGIRSMIEKDLDENYDVPIDLFRRHWKELNESKKFRWNRSLAEPSFGIRLLRGRSHLDGGSPDKDTANRGIRISRVADDSWASQSGLVRGDRVMKWNGASVLDPKQFNTYLVSALANGDPNVQLSIVRKDEELDLQLDFSTLSSKSLDGIQPDRTQQNAGKPHTQLASLPQVVQRLEDHLDDLSVVVETKRHKALGTLVFWTDQPASDRVVTKSSLTKEDTATIVLASGETANGSVVKRDEALDLALIKLEKSFELPQHLPRLETDPRLGKFLMSPDPTGAGSVSVQSSGLFSTTGSGYLGIELEPDVPGFTIKDMDKNSAAKKAGLESGDVILKIDNKEIKSLDEGLSILGDKKPGQKIVVTLQRGDEEKNLNVILGTRESFNDSDGSHIADHFDGGKSRVSRFPRVYVHDSRVVAKHCGGPVFDLESKFIGLNMARPSRTQSYIVPAEDVISFATEVAAK